MNKEAAHEPRGNPVGADILAALGRTRFSYDVVNLAKLCASLDSANYYNQHMSSVPNYSARVRLLDAAVALTTLEGGLVLEFGVASGRTINRIASKMPSRTIYGFDSFRGLPETWLPNFKQGHFAQPVPEVVSNVELRKGWFEDTLPPFVADHPKLNIDFLHIDCDLYSSTKTIFGFLKHKIVKGTVILFDEYFNYPGWREHEYKAFQEFVEERNIKYDYKGIVAGHYQVAVVITNVGAA